MARIRFGLFEFGPATGELTRGGVPVKLQPQPARVLELLVERPGEIVTRDELQRRVWGDETFVDFERGLNFCIAQIRSALGDSGESPRYIETIPKRGYRFIAPVDRGHEEGAVGVWRQALRLRAPEGTKVRIAVAVLLAVIATAVFAAWRLMLPSRWSASRASTAAAISIAVIPFDNQTGSSEYDPVAQGLADATVVRLSQIEGEPSFSVVGNAAALRAPRDRRNLKTIGEELRVDYVVLGQVQREAQQVRVLAHLIRVSDQRHLWANRFDRASFSLAAQGEIADAVAQAVADRLRQPPPVPDRAP